MRTKISLDVDHICMVVNDLQSTLEKITRVFETSEVKVHEDSGEAKVYGDKIAKYKLKIAFIKISDSMNLELLQVLKGNPVERDWLMKHGEGIHHLGIKVRDVGQEMSKWKEKGIKVILEDDDRLVYLDTESILGMIVELYNPKAFTT